MPGVRDGKCRGYPGLRPVRGTHLLSAVRDISPGGRPAGGPRSSARDVLIITGIAITLLTVSAVTAVLIRPLAVGSST